MTADAWEKLGRLAYETRWNASELKAVPYPWAELPAEHRASWVMVAKALIEAGKAE